MKKKDLKDGMIVKLKNDTRYMLLNGILMNYKYFIKLNQLDNDLKFPGNSEWDAISIYKANIDNLNDVLKEDYLELIWERKEDDMKEKNICCICGEVIEHCTISQYGKEFCSGKCADLYKKALIEKKEVEPCKDCDKEYTIQEVFEFEESTEFVVHASIVKIEKGILNILYDDEGKWYKCHLSKDWLNKKFKLKRKEKEVEFIDALEYYNELKTIYCISEGEKYKFNFNTESNFKSIPESELITIIRLGKWFVED